MKRFKTHSKELHEIYSTKEAEIKNRLDEFGKKWISGSEKEIFGELSFCLLTPQSKAKLCWEAILKLKENGLLYAGSEMAIRGYLNKVRFKNKKAKYICLARKYFFDNGGICIKKRIDDFSDVFSKREWLVRDIKGIGYKEASHFLRNIGYGSDVAILDRHILKNLKYFGVISDLPKTVTKRAYFEIEKKMMDFAEEIDIPAAHLDLLFWCKETGEIFK